MANGKTARQGTIRYSLFAIRYSLFAFTSLALRREHLKPVAAKTRIAGICSM
jgi:hypothetical protein